MLTLTPNDLDTSTHHVSARLAGALAVLALVAMPALAQEAPRSPTPSSVPIPARVTEVARGLEHPWGLAFLPDGRMLVTERPGRLRIVGRDGTLSEPLTGVPEVLAQGQGGLLDVALSPNFAQDRLVYFSYAEPGSGGAGTAVARGRLGERGLEGAQVIWRQEPKVSGAQSLGLAPRVSTGRHALRHAGRSVWPARPRAGSLDDARQDRPHQCRRLDAARQSRSSAGTALVRRSGRTAIATSRARRSTRAASCGRSSTARAAATS